MMRSPLLRALPPAWQTAAPPPPSRVLLSRGAPTRPLRRVPVLAIVLAAMAAVMLHGGEARAQLASRPVEEWLKVLDAEARIAGLRTADVASALELHPGDVVADLGAGAGPFVVALAQAVGATGRVYAVEIDRDFFPHIEKRAKAAGISNVQTVLGAPSDPQLPEKNVDVAFMHDVLHHVRDRAAYLQAAAGYLSPGGRIAIIDYHAANSPHRDDASLVITKEQTSDWMRAAGLTLLQDIPLFQDKWFLVFGRAPK